MAEKEASKGQQIVDAWKDEWSLEDRTDVDREFCDKVNASLVSRIDAAFAAPWQPIETAPKHQWVWLFFPRTPSAHDQTLHQSAGVQTSRGWWCSAGGGAGGRCEEGFEPTHWMQLPDIPEVKD